MSKYYGSCNLSLGLQQISFQGGGRLSQHSLGQENPLKPRDLNDSGGGAEPTYPPPWVRDASANYYR